MKVDFNRGFKSLDGSPLDITTMPKQLTESPPLEHLDKYEKRGTVYLLKEEYRRVLTLGKVATDALTHIAPGDEAVPGSKKAERGRLAFKIAESEDGLVDVTVEQLADLKPLIARYFGPLVVAQAFTMIEGDEKPAGDKAGKE